MMLIVIGLARVPNDHACARHLQPIWNHGHSTLRMLKS